MERLTDGRIYTFEGKKIEKVENDYIMNVQKRLSEYEDLEITPEQVREMSRLYQQKCEEVARMEKENAWVKYDDKLPSEDECFEHDGVFIVTNGYHSYIRNFSYITKEFFHTAKIERNKSESLIIDNDIIKWRNLP